MKPFFNIHINSLLVALFQMFIICQSALKRLQLTSELKLFGKSGFSVFQSSPISYFSPSNFLVALSISRALSSSFYLPDTLQLEAYDKVLLKFSLVPPMRPLLLQLGFQFRSLLLWQGSTENPSQLLSQCRRLCVSRFSTFRCSMQVITILAQGTFNISQFHGRVFQI